MNEQLYFEIAVVLITAVLGAAATRWLKVPAVLGLLVVGMLIGPAGFGLVRTDSLEVFANLGAVFLLFSIGTELSLKTLSRVGPIGAIVVVAETTTVLVGTTLFSHFVLGQPWLASFYIGSALCISSTALIFKLSKQLGWTEREDLHLVFAVLIYEDLIAVLLLAVLAGLSSANVFTLLAVGASLLKAGIIFGAFYFVLPPLLEKILERLSEYDIEEAVQFIAIVLITGLSFIAITIGLSPTIGAFLAGVLVSSLREGKKMEDAVKHFGFFFISVFFLSMGMLADYRVLLTRPELIIGLAIVAVVLKFLGNFSAAYLVGYRTPVAVFSGVMMVAIGEFSLLIVKSGTDLGIVNPVFLSVMAAIILLTALISYPLTLQRERVLSVYRLLPPSVGAVGRRLRGWVEGKLAKLEGRRGNRQITDFRFKRW